MCGRMQMGKPLWPREGSTSVEIPEHLMTFAYILNCEKCVFGKISKEHMYFVVLGCIYNILIPILGLLLLDHG